MKKVLLVANTSKFFSLFLKNDIEILQRLGYEVHCFSDFHNPDYKELDTEVSKMGVVMHDSIFERQPFSLQHIATYQNLKRVLEREKFEMIHCHTPMGGALARVAAKDLRKKGTKVIYTTHGFHFFKGAPASHWLIYYPVEYLLSRYTDIIITINREDYNRAKGFFAKRVEYIPGVGLDYKKYINAAASVDRREKRKSLGLNENAFLVVSVGELNENKNHITAIRAIAKTRRKEVEGVICGIGGEREHLMQEAERLGISDRIHFLGFRMDIEEILPCMDVFLMPSKREGLGMAALEGMAAGLPLLSSRIHGIKDYTKNKVTGLTYHPEDVKGFSRGINTLLDRKNIRLKIGKFNSKYAKKFSQENSRKVMERIYRNC